jgi:hypothetical protein
VPHLTLNGVTVPVAEGGASRSSVYVGQLGERAIGGRLGRALRRTAREWRFRTTPLLVSEVDAWAGLIEGRGHHFSFDSTSRSDRGRALASGSMTVGAGPGSLTGGHAPYGLVSGYSGRAAWQLEPSSAWTLVFSGYRNQGGTMWRRFLVRSDGAKWVQGARDDAYDVRTPSFNTVAGELSLESYAYGGVAWAAGQVRAVGSKTLGLASNGTTYAYEVSAVAGDATTDATMQPTWPVGYGATVQDGNVTWRNIAGDSGTAYCGDLVWLPYAVPDAWASAIYAFHNARPWSALPRLVAGGSFAPAEVTVRGEVVGADAVQWQSGAGLVQGETLEFLLREV